MNSLNIIDEAYLKETVKVLAMQIRAMNKDLRIFCSNELTKIISIPHIIIAKMVDKESSF